MPLSPPTPLRHDWDCTNQIATYEGSPHPLFRTNILTGIEVEALHPRTSRPSALQPFGILKIDGSLRVMTENTARHCFELATHAASGNMLHALLLDLTDRLASERCEVNSSCGLHIHANVTHLTEQQRANLRFWWTIYEDLFFAIQPPNRASVTGFSRPASSYPTYNSWLAQRYSALNVIAFSRHGTYEWRLGEGTTNYRAILTQIQLINAFIDVFANRPQIPGASDPAYQALLAMDDRTFLIHFLKELALPTATIKAMVARIRAYNPSALLHSITPITAHAIPTPTLIDRDRDYDPVDDNDDDDESYDDSDDEDDEEDSD